jgi:hypothetical protein
LTVTLKTLAMIVVVTATGLAGCGEYACEDFCEDRAECSDGRTNRANCESSCEDLERQNEDFGCNDEYDSIMNCVEKLDDVCDRRTAERECGNEADAWEDCIVAHCMEHPSAGDCDGMIPPPG